MPAWRLACQTFLALAAALLLPAAWVFASPINPYSGSGADVSYPQCSSLPAQGPGGFAIVGANGGKAFTANPCLASEVQWASQFSAPTTFYMNLNYPVGSTASNGLSGKYGNCQHSDKVCQALNYGYKAAAYAQTQAQSTGAAATGPWWIDIETANSWSSNPSLNADVIQGAQAYFTDHSITSGIYSTSSMWTKIAGAYSPSVPNWVVAAAGATCSTPLFSNGFVWLVQQSSGTNNGDLACP
jgi:hypothetical protein